eukprot:1188233-Prorocentrum_minimum.AAC.3
MNPPFVGIQINREPLHPRGNREVILQTVYDNANIHHRSHALTIVNRTIFLEGRSSELCRSGEHLTTGFDGTHSWRNVTWSKPSTLRAAALPCCPIWNLQATTYKVVCAGFPVRTTSGLEPPCEP